MNIAEWFARLGIWLAFFYAGGKAISWQALLLMVSLITYSMLVERRTTRKAGSWAVTR